MASTDLAIASIDAGESEAVWPLSIEAGWNQNVADWRFMLGAGHGFGLRGSGHGEFSVDVEILQSGHQIACTIFEHFGL